MPNPLKDKLQQRFVALQKQRSDLIAQHTGALARITEQIDALRTLAQQWDTLTVEQALAELEKTGVRLDVQA